MFAFNVIFLNHSFDVQSTILLRITLLPDSGRVGGAATYFSAHAIKNSELPAPATPGGAHHKETLP